MSAETPAESEELVIAAAPETETATIPSIATSANSSNAPLVLLSHPHNEKGNEAEEQKGSRNSDENSHAGVVATGAGCENLSRRASARNPHVLLDEHGNEQTFGSVLGLLTRKFLDLIQASQSGTVDMNESAVYLRVPKRRIYDITNVLEGVGILEKRSKNHVAWKGSELILGDTIDVESRDEIDRLRDEISSCHKEEALMDQWTTHLFKLAPSLQAAPISSSDIVQALYYSKDDVEMATRDTLVDETGKPRRAVLAVHAPFDSVACIPSTSDGSPERQLYVGTKAALHKFNDETGSTKKRQLLTLQSRKGVKLPRHDDKLQVYVLSMFFDEETQKLKASDMKMLSDVSETHKSGIEMRENSRDKVKRSSSWDVAESLANDEGVSEFFGVTDESQDISLI